MFVLLFGYVLLMLSMVRKLKPTNENETTTTKFVKDYNEKQQTTVVFSA